MKAESKKMRFNGFSFKFDHIHVNSILNYNILKNYSDFWLLSSILISFFSEDFLNNDFKKQMRGSKKEISSIAIQSTLDIVVNTICMHSSFLFTISRGSP